MQKRTLLFPLGVAVFLISATAFSSAYLHSIDTSFSGYLSGLMLNFWGGEQNQLIRVNLYNHSIALYENGDLYTSARIAGTGNPNNRTATPTGKFRILSKDKRHISGLSGAIMPYSLRFYEGYYFHDIPLYPSGEVITTRYSAGCIRLPTALAANMFDWAHIGAYVEIYSAKLARAEDAQTVYLLTEDGYRQPIATEHAFLSRGYQWKDVVVVPAGELSGLPIGGYIQ